jgi:anti-sigma-K factor RskA
MDYSKRTLVEALASQYVAGTLRGAARRRFESLLPAHPALRQAVREWQARLMPLTGVLPPEAPPPAVWKGIEARLWPAPRVGVAGTPSAPWWQRLGAWRSLAGFASVAALAFALLLANPRPDDPPVVVVLQPLGSDPAAAGTVVASFSADGQSLTAKPLTKVSIQNDRVLELWWAPEKGAPTSLGLIRPDGTTVLSRGRLPGGLKKSGIDHMAVSVEPPGGSPTGQPTGPVIFYGKLQL